MDESAQRKEWLKNARRGDRLAVTKLLASYYPMLTGRIKARMSPQLKSRLEPEDILQEVCADVFRQIDGFSGSSESAFVNWVLTIIESKLIDATRALHRRKRDVAREMPGDAVPKTGSYWNLMERLCAHSTTPSRVIRREEAVGALLASISSLSEPHRQVIQLRFLEGRSVEEVAAELAKSEAAVVALTKRALEALRERMDALGEFTRIT